MLNLSVDSEITLLRLVGFYENGYSRSFSQKTFEKHLYLVCFSQKRLRSTRISHAFFKNV